MFQIGDIISAWSKIGLIDQIDKDLLRVKLIDEEFPFTTVKCWFRLDGRLQSWNSEPTLIMANEEQKIIWKEYMKNESKEKGFGLIELMVYVSIMSIVAMGSAQMHYNSLLQIKTNDVRNSLTSLIGSLSSVALNQASCSAALTKTTQKYGGQLRFDLPDGTVIANGFPIMNYPLVSGSFTQNNAQIATIDANGTKTYFGTITLVTSTTYKIMGVPIFGAKPIGSIYITVNSNGQITGCSPTLTQPAPPVTQIVDNTTTITNTTIVQEQQNLNPLAEIIDGVLGLLPNQQNQIAKYCLSEGENYNNGVCTFTHTTTTISNNDK